MKNRQEEIRALLAMSSEEVKTRAGKHLLVCPDLHSLHQHMASAIAAEIAASQFSDRSLNLILPVGPTGQYPLLAELIKEQKLSLHNCWFFFMDEYCLEDEHAVSPKHPLSFQGEAFRLFFDKLPSSCGLDQERVFFPNEQNINSLPQTIEAAGGIDTCYGGIGIHGHIAFNEPEPNVRDTTCRMVKLNDFTVTINAIRSQIGGNLEGYPRYAYTLGMREILSARQIRLYCRNGIDLDWANTVLRLALFGTTGDDYPVTHIRDHKNYVIITDKDTLKTPRNIL